LNHGSRPRLNNWSLRARYDMQHVITHLRVLDACDDKAGWREVARLVLHTDPEKEADRAREWASETHLAALLLLK
jgi:hypothetical protein